MLPQDISTSLSTEEYMSVVEQPTVEERHVIIYTHLHCIINTQDLTATRVQDELLYYTPEHSLYLALYIYTG